jgi:pyroglutamyl-peptidase
METNMPQNNSDATAGSAIKPPVSKKRRRRLCVQARASKQTRVSCLVTGFDPFGGGAVNPTELLTRALPPLLQSSCHDAEVQAWRIELHRQVLPTAARAGWDKLKASIDAAIAASTEPVLIVMTGLAAGTDRLQIERFALNVRDYSVPDNAGETAQDQVIDLSQPDLIRTLAPLPELRQAILRQGFPCRISNHAGTFICNELYFKAMAYVRHNPRVAGIVFVHVPMLEQFAATCELYGSMAVSRKALNVRGSAERQVALLRQAMVALIFALSELTVRA